MRNRLVSLMIAAALGLVPGLRADEVLLPVCHKDCAPDCAPACPKACVRDNCNKHCVPTNKTKTVETTVYSSGCEDFCVPRCSFTGMLGGGCGKKSCDSCNACPTGCNDEPCHKCGRVRTKKYLIIKVKKEEQCVNACEVVEGCPASCAAPCVMPAPCGSVPAIRTFDKPAEKLPTKPEVVDPKKK